MKKLIIIVLILIIFCVIFFLTKQTETFNSDFHNGKVCLDKRLPYNIIGPAPYNGRPDDLEQNEWLHWFPSSDYDPINCGSAKDSNTLATGPKGGWTGIVYGSHLTKYHKAGEYCCHRGGGNNASKAIENLKENINNLDIDKLDSFIVQTNSETDWKNNILSMDNYEETKNKWFNNRIDELEINTQIGGFRRQKNGIYSDANCAFPDQDVKIYDDLIKQQVEDRFVEAIETFVEGVTNLVPSDYRSGDYKKDFIKDLFDTISAPKIYNKSLTDYSDNEKIKKTIFSNVSEVKDDDNYSDLTPDQQNAVRLELESFLHDINIIEEKVQKIKDFYEILDTFNNTLLNLDKEIKKLKIGGLKEEINEIFYSILTYRHPFTILPAINGGFYTNGYNVESDKILKDIVELIGTTHESGSSAKRIYDSAALLAFDIRSIYSKLGKIKKYYTGEHRVSETGGFYEIDDIEQQYYDAIDNNDVNNEHNAYNKMLAILGNDTEDLDLFKKKNDISISCSSDVYQGITFDSDMNITIFTDKVGDNRMLPGVKNFKKYVDAQERGIALSKLRELNTLLQEAEFEIILIEDTKLRQQSAEQVCNYSKLKEFVEDPNYNNFKYVKGCCSNELYGSNGNQYNQNFSKEIYELSEKDGALNSEDLQKIYTNLYSFCRHYKEPEFIPILDRECGSYNQDEHWGACLANQNCELNEDASSTPICRNKQI